MADLKAAYRLLDCEDATLEALTEPHRRPVYRAALGPSLRPSEA